MKRSLAHSVLALSALSTFACKSYKPTPGIREAMAKRSKTEGGPVVISPTTGSASAVADNALPANTVIIAKLKLPSEVARYNRNCVVLQSKDTVDQVIKNYSLGTTIDVVPFQNYTVTVELYLDNVLVYSNVYCKTSRSFNANLGRNIFTVPVCAEEDEGSLATAGCKM